MSEVALAQALLTFRISTLGQSSGGEKRGDLQGSSHNSIQREPSQYLIILLEDPLQANFTEALQGND